MGEPSGEGGARGPARYRLAVAASIVLPLMAIAALVVALSQRPTGSGIPPGAVIADFIARPVAEDRPAPQFRLPTLTGSGTISLARYRGRVVVLNVWASWCEPCRLEAAELVRAWRTYRPRGVQFLGVDHRDRLGNARAFQRRFGLRSPLAFDPSGSVAASYGTLGIPTTFVIDAEGRIVYRFLGRVDAAVLDPILDRVLGS